MGLCYSSVVLKQKFIVRSCTNARARAHTHGYIDDHIYFEMHVSDSSVTRLVNKE
jgi:hypothetical protein